MNLLHDRRGKHGLRVDDLLNHGLGNDLLHNHGLGDYLLNDLLANDLLPLNDNLPLDDSLPLPGLGFRGAGQNQGNDDKQKQNETDHGPPSFRSRDKSSSSTAPFCSGVSAGPPLGM